MFENWREIMQGVVCREADPNLTNVRPQRTLFGICNGDADLNGYKAEQIKLLQLNQNDFLGKAGHYHAYAELYYVVRGEVTFDLWDRENFEKGRFVLKPGWILLVPAGVAHRAYGAEGTLMLGSSEGPYTFDPPADIPADFEPVGDLPYGLL